MYFNIKSDNLYTYAIMAASAIGYLIAKKGGYATGPCGIAFVVAPISTMMHKREVDLYETT